MYKKEKTITGTLCLNYFLTYSKFHFISEYVFIILKIWQNIKKTFLSIILKYVQNMFLNE